MTNLLKSRRSRTILKIMETIPEIAAIRIMEIPETMGMKMAIRITVAEIPIIILRVILEIQAVTQVEVHLAGELHKAPGL